MGQMRASASLLVLAGVLALGPIAQAGEPATPATAAPADKKPATKAGPAKDPLADLLATLDKDVAAQIAILADTTKPDKERVTARRELLADKLLAKGSIAALIALGKVATEGDLPEQPGLDKDGISNNVRMHVALALSRVRRPDSKPIVDNYALLKGWLDSKSSDPAVRHWTARAIVNTRTAEALKIVEPVLLSPKEGEEVITGAVARVLGEWRGTKSQPLAVAVLLKMLASKTAAVRVAGVQGLQVAGSRVNEPPVVRPLVGLVRSDADGSVWRAAEGALNEISKGMPIRRLSLPVAAPAKVRARNTRVWLFEWDRAKKKAAKAAAKKAGKT